MEPQYLTAHVATENAILLMDVVLANGEHWLVPEWLESQDGRLQTPALAIRLDCLPYQATALGGVDSVVNNSIPTAVLRGDVASSVGIDYQVLRGPSPHFGWWTVPTRQ